MQRSRNLLSTHPPDRLPVAGRLVDKRVWYLLSSYAAINYTNNWAYVFFAAIGSWIGAFASVTFLHAPPARSQAGFPSIDPDL
jgi:hypothetical protein